MATSMQDYSPINSLQKMVDTMPVNNVNSTGSEKKKHKKHKKKENMAPPPPPSTLPQLQTTSDFRPNELLKEMGFDISPTNSSSNSTVSPTTVTIVDEKQYDLNSCLFRPCSWNYFKPSLTWNGMPNAPSLESVESLCIEPCRTLTWVYLIEEYTTPTEN